MIRRFAPVLAAAVIAAACSADRVTAPEALADSPLLSLGLPDGATADTLPVGGTVQLTAALPRRKGKTTASDTRWSSSDTGVAAVSATGLVTAVGAGSAVVTAENNLGSESASIVVTGSATVPPPPADTTPAPAPTGSGPELPRAYVNSDPVPVTGQTITVRAGASLQAALDAAQPGDQLLLEAGATFTGNFVLRAKSGTGWITIAGTGGSTLPPAGQRVSPANAATMPKLVTPNSTAALATASGAHHYRLVGLEIAAAPAVTSASALVSLGATGTAQSTLAQVPHHLVLDRVYVHGHPTLNFPRCVALNSATTAIVDSHISECHSRTQESQAVGGWNGPGPFKLVNNYLEGAGENVMFGGSDPSISQLVPSDIEIRRNHFSKPLAWQGESWIVKNLFELKNARRVLVEGNVFENCWGAAQSFAILWKSVNQGGTAPWSTTSDVTFQYNLVRRVNAAINIAGLPESQPAVRAARFRIAHNVFESVGDGAVRTDTRAGRLWQVMEAVAVEIAHNTGLGTAHGLLLVGAPTAGGFTLRDNVFDAGPGVASASGQGYGTPALDYHVPGWTMAGNVVVGSAAGSTPFPSGNVYAATATAAGLSSDLRAVAAPALGSRTTDGLVPGADRAAVERRTLGVVSQ